MYFGLTSDEVRKVAYEFALKNNKDLPLNWLEKNMIGIDWFQAFMKCHKESSLWQPESTSIARASSFNEVNVSKFFDLPEDVKSRYSTKGVLNIDETGCMTVQQSGKVVAATGAKQVGALSRVQNEDRQTDRQTDSHTVLCRSVTARVHFMCDGRPGCIATAHPSGLLLNKFGF